MEEQAEKSAEDFLILVKETVFNDLAVSQQTRPESIQKPEVEAL